MARRRNNYVFENPLLPPPRDSESRGREPFRYVTIPLTLYKVLAKAASDRGYKPREFVIEILKRALELK